MQDHFGILLLQGVKARHLAHDPEQLNLWVALAGMSLLALSGHSAASHQCPLLEVKQASGGE